MVKRQQQALTVLVTDASRGSAIAIIRALGRRGYRVIAADSKRRSAGFCSRYASQKLQYPVPESDPQGLVQSLLQAAQTQQVDLIIPVTDAVILPLSAARRQFDGVCKLALPEASALDVVTNKHKTRELAVKLGVPVPRTQLVHTAAEALTQAGSLGWPVVLKPQTSRLYREQATIESFTVCYAKSPDHLAEQMRHFEGRCPVLLQEYICGTGYGVELLLDQGQPLAAFQHKRLREIPINGGASAFRESVPLDPTMYHYAVQLLQELNWTGLAMVEFKVDEHGPKLMEINGRVWGSLPLAIHSGVDFPSRLVELYLSDSSFCSKELHPTYRTQVRSRNLELELTWIATVLWGKKRYPFLAMPKRLEGLKALLELLNPAYKFDVLSLHDPKPGIAELEAIIKKFGSKLPAAV